MCMSSNRAVVAQVYATVAVTAFALKRTPAEVSVEAGAHGLGFVRMTPINGLPLTADLEVDIMLDLALLQAEQSYFGHLHSQQAARKVMAGIEKLTEIGDTRSPDTILEQLSDRVNGVILEQEGNIDRVAQALVREGRLDTNGLQQVAGAVQQ